MAERRGDPCAVTMSALVLATLSAPACAAEDAPPELREGAARGLTPARAPDRGRVLGGEPVPRVVQPDVHVETRDDLLAHMSSESRSAIASAPAPVLLPPRRELLANAKLMTGPTWWSLWTEHDGLTINLQASMQARLYPGMPRARASAAVRGVPAIVTANEGIWSASWIERGVAYSLEVQCRELAMEPCRDGEYVSSLAESLAWVSHQGGGAR